VVLAAKVVHSQNLAIGIVRVAVTCSLLATLHAEDVGHLIQLEAWMDAWMVKYPWEEKAKVASSCLEIGRALIAVITSLPRILIVESAKRPIRIQIHSCKP
jgi:hypothetical protein